MLVRLFRRVNSFSVMLTILLCLLPWLLNFSNHIHTGHPMPLYLLILNGVSGIGNYFLYFFGAVLILAGAVYANHIVNTFDASENRSYLPGVFYVMIMCLFPEWLLFHPILIVNIIVLHIVGKVLRIYREPENLSLNFDIGLFIGLASLFYFPAVYFFFFFIVASFMLRPFYWRDWATAFTGFMIPFIFVALYHFMTDQFAEFTTSMTRSLELPNPLHYDLSKKVTWGVLTLMIILSVISVANNYFKSITVARKTQVVILVLLGTTLFTGIMSGEMHPVRYLVMAIPLSLLFSYFALHIRNKYMADSVLLIIFFILIFNHLYVLL